MDAIAEIAPSRVLDVNIGFGIWGALLRELAQPTRERIYIEGIQARGGAAEPHHPLLYDRVHRVENCNITPLLTDSWDLILLGDILETLPRQAARELVGRALEIGKYVQVMIRQTPELTASDFEAHDPVRSSLEGDRAFFLLSRNDPKGLRRSRSMENAFASTIDLYRSFGDESISGPGSSLFHTSEIRQRLPLLIQDIGAKSLLDAPCGDFNWMKHVHLGVDRYIGIDVLPEVIRENQRKFRRPGRTFLVADLTEGALPEVDLIFSRDCLVHFSYRDILRALKSFKRSKSRFLLTTTFVNRKTNSDLATGEWRPD